MDIKSIYIADVQRLFVDCLTTSLQSTKRFNILGSSQSGAEAYNEVRRAEPGLLITDQNLADINGINLIRKIKAGGLRTRIILLTAEIFPAVIHKALSAGADGIILKSDRFSLLIEAISVIHQRRFLSPGISDPLVNSFLSNGNGAFGQRTSPLSDREEQVAMLIGEGESSKEISELLCISEKTVSKHRGNIFKKLNIKNTAQLVKYVYENNMVG
ncbi:MAG TPA: response regulator transcription factor [Gammaproteobacteria bacterium]|nr:response regulator transcription factor [Gammaproteobacteria bacterium]